LQEDTKMTRGHITFLVTEFSLNFSCALENVSNGVTDRLTQLTDCPLDEFLTKWMHFVW